MIPYGRQDIRAEDIEAVIAVLKSDWLTQGPTVPLFEKAVADYCGARHGVAVNSATSALHLACRALGVGPGDLVWTSPISFVASANCALYCGADIDFVDIDPATGNLCPKQLGHRLNQAKAAGRLPKIIIPVHLAGLPCDMDSIASMARAHGISIIEDASHAIGARYQDEAIGSCAHSDITVFSFHPVKIITTGEGGMAMTNIDDLADRMKLLRSHGITKERGAFEQTAAGGWHYEQQDLGYNYRMTDIHAALGISQLERLDTYVSRRADLAQRYDKALAGLPLITPGQCPDRASAHHLYAIRLASPARRDAAYRTCRKSGIATNVHYMPIHLQPYYRRLGFGPGNHPVAEEYSATTLSLPLFPTLTHDEQDRVIAALHDLLA